MRFARVRCRACRTKAPVGAFWAWAAALKSVRRFNRSIVGFGDFALTLRARLEIGVRNEIQTARPTSVLSTQLLAPVARAATTNLAAALGRHAGAKAVAAFAHQFARLVGPFHQDLLDPRFARFGAAYTQALPARQTRPIGLVSHGLQGADLGFDERMSQTERQDATQETRQEIKPDICVIGAGAGGLASAAAAAAFGVNVVLIEPGPKADEDGSGGLGDAAPWRPRRCWPRPRAPT